jgi:hypothetical protein
MSGSDNINIEKLKSRAKKLKALADRGIEGEKDTARRMYEDFIKKHNLEDNDEGTNVRILKIKYADDMLILFNVILSVNPFSKPVYEKNYIRVELDKEDYTEVKCKYRHFVKLWRIEKELLTMSFFSKHNVHFAPDDYAKKKWREHNAMNQQYVQAQVDADILQEKATKFKS